MVVPCALFAFVSSPVCLSGARHGVPSLYVWLSHRSRD